MAKDYEWIVFGNPLDSNRIKRKQMDGKVEHPFVSVPTVYEAFDWLIAKLNWKTAFIRYERCVHQYSLWCYDAKYHADLCSDKYASYRKAINILIKEYEKR